MTDPVRIHFVGFIFPFLLYKMVSIVNHFNSAFPTLFTGSRESAINAQADWNKGVFPTSCSDLWNKNSLHGLKQPLWLSPAQSIYITLHSTPNQ